MLPRPPDYTAINDLEATPVPATDPLNISPPKTLVRPKFTTSFKKRGEKREAKLG
jgi:hypothetical protein